MRSFFLALLLLPACSSCTGLGLGDFRTPADDTQTIPPAPHKTLPPADTAVGQTMPVAPLDTAASTMPVVKGTQPGVAPL